MRVSSSYLNDIVAEFHSENNVCLVTCLYLVSQTHSIDAVLCVFAIT